jgi:outer membrane protein OmpA-like peptidoglycan-associated protein
MSKITLVVSFLFFAVVGLTAQTETTINASKNTTTKGHAMELGLHAGHFFTSGNVEFKPGFGTGIHLRQALDYVFSLRANALYAQGKGEDAGNVRSNETTYFSGSLQAIASLNNLKWSMEERKTNLYAFAGFGVNTFEAELTEQDVITKIDGKLTAQMEFGAGISFRINERFNVGIEHQVAYLLSSQRADWLDGVQTFTNADDRATFKDLVNYTSIRLNFNLTGKDQKTEPLYWVNPMEAIVNDVQLLKDTRVTLADEDGDGVIDALDEEEETVAGAPVNAKGISLDSDNDGVPDYNDLEPYSAPGAKVNDRGVAEKEDIMAEVERMIEERLKDFQPVMPEPQATGTLSLYDWFLPSVYFGTGSYTVGVSDYGTLANVALVMKNNKDTKFSVIGFTDSSGSEDANNLLSYKRSKSVLELLVNKFNVPRQQLVLIWKGEESSIVEGSNIVNRRVEFHVNNGAAEMSAPGN